MPENRFLHPCLQIIAGIYYFYLQHTTCTLDLCLPKLWHTLELDVLLAFPRLQNVNQACFNPCMSGCCRKYCYLKFCKSCIALPSYYGRWCERYNYGGDLFKVISFHFSCLVLFDDSTWCYFLLSPQYARNLPEAYLNYYNLDWDIEEPDSTVDILAGLNITLVPCWFFHLLGVGSSLISSKFVDVMCL